MKSHLPIYICSPYVAVKRRRDLKRFQNSGKNSWINLQRGLMRPQRPTLVTLSAMCVEQVIPRQGLASPLTKSREKIRLGVFAFYQCGTW